MFEICEVSVSLKPIPGELVTYILKQKLINRSVKYYNIRIAPDVKLDFKNI